MPPDTPTHRARRVTWYGMLLLMGFGAAFGAAFLMRWLGWVSNTSEAIPRSAGGLLQIGGVVTVALGIHELRRQFNLPRLLDEVSEEGRRIAAHVKRLWWRITGSSPPPKIGYGYGVGTAGGFGSAHAVALPGPNAPVEERLVWLEKEVSSLQTATVRLRSDLQQEANKRAEAIEAERNAREERAQAMELQLRNMAVGGIHLELVGLCWLFLGIILVTWPGEIGSAF